jgi:hypothetical protein
MLQYGEVIGSYKYFRNEEVHDLSSESNVIRVIK